MLHLIHLIRCAAVAAVMVAAGGKAGFAQTFNLMSVNTLHFGWGQDVAKNTRKCEALRESIRGQDIVILQEVMRNINLDCLNPDIIPAGTWAFSTTDQALGPGTYKEYYLFMYRSSDSIRISTTLLFPQLTANAAFFARPPAGMLFTVQRRSLIAPVPDGKLIWVLNYHAVFGKRIADRRAEVAHMPDVMREFSQRTLFNHTAPPLNGYPVVIGGDWNLPVADTAFGDILNTALGFGVTPDEATSLKRSGAPSQPYDHFAALRATVSPPTLYPDIPDRLAWRADVSDHLAIRTVVTLP